VPHNERQLHFEAVSFFGGPDWDFSAGDGLRAKPI
jgi:hypothetical protein